MSATWERCLDRLEVDLTPEQFNTWIRPLHAVEDGSILRLLAPNHFVRDWVNKNFLDLIEKILGRYEASATNVTVQVGSRVPSTGAGHAASPTMDRMPVTTPSTDQRPATGVRAEFTFENFVEGKSNQMARAASMLVATNPRDTDNNPLFIYGGVGLGKTHLMHAIGNRMLQENPGANVVYLHSEQFVAEMVTALQHNRINDFKRLYRSVDALLIDDIQFFAGKERSQEEFFHTFNRLLERERLVVLTSDRYPEGNSRSRESSQDAVWRRTSNRYRASGARDASRHPDEQGGGRGHRVPRRRRVLHRASDAVERSRGWKGRCDESSPMPGSRDAR